MDADREDLGVAREEVPEDLVLAVPLVRADTIDLIVLRIFEEDTVGEDLLPDMVVWGV